jgi:PelA/Pel-15E family pectate lyase
MKPLQLLCALCLLAAAPSAAAAELRAEVALPSQARSALVRATDYLRSISTEGGYLWRYSPDLKHRLGEEIATATQIWVQPPGTPALGQAFLRAYAVTREPRYLALARAAALALVRGQLVSGGWDYLVEFDTEKRKEWAFRSDTAAAAPEQKNVSTYDDDNTQSALRFLLAFLDAAKSAPDARDARIRESLQYGLRKLVEAQYPNGGWPQRWAGTAHDLSAQPVLKASYPEDYPREQPDANYIGHYTLNDDTQSDAIRTMLDANQRTGRSEYLRAAKRGGEFLLLAQMPEPQPVWAQQYDSAMHPAWARAFEPPSVTSRESADVVELLLDLYLATGEKRYIEPVPAALAWFQRSELAPGLWSRLYELQTNRPIYGDRDKRIHYTLEEISEERRTHYAWQRSFGIPAVIEHAAKLLELGRKKWLASHKPAPLTPAQKAARAAELEPRVREIIGALDEQGRWITPASRKVQGLDGPWVEMGTFDSHLRTLCDYLEVAPR